MTRSPEIEAAYQMAKAAKLPIVSIDVEEITISISADGNLVIEKSLFWQDEPNWQIRLEFEPNNVPTEAQALSERLGFVFRAVAALLEVQQ